jgi:hypothetical protein
MATTPPLRQAIYGLDSDNYCKGAGNVCVNGTPVGMLKAGTKVTLTPVSNKGDLDIECLQYEGDLLGRRQGGTVYKLTAELVETSQANVVMALDIASTVGPNNAVGLGRSQKVATLHEVSYFGEGPQQQTRKWTFHQCIIDRMPEMVIGAGNEPNSLVVSFLVCRTFSFTEDFCYGQFSDYAA